MLKKERDMAKHLVLEIEGETAKLRRAYANELLEFEKNKMLAHKEAEARYVSQIEKLEKELEDARNLIAHFRKLVAEREARIEQLEHMLNIAKHAKHVKSTEGKEKQPKKARHKKRRVKK
jgi:LPS O-antigen subunit length determinant protein (WzzB/FepE family)